MVTLFLKYFSEKLVTENEYLSSKPPMTINQEQHLIQKIVGGNSQAYGELVEHYKDLVFTLALRMMKHREEAEEVAQDTFIKAYKSLRSFKGDSKFSTWMYRITYNTCLDRIKSNKRKHQEIEINELTLNKLKSIDNALDNMVDNEREKLVKQCVEALPSQESFMLTLYYYEDLSLDEISKIIDLPTNTIKVRLFRTRKKLATILKETLEPEILEHYERKR